jgi:predicted enzyme related to lactoylglutathione lyase
VESKLAGASLSTCVLVQHEGDEMPRVVHFEIHASDPQRAITFYEKLFGWAFQKWEGPMDYWLITTGPESAPGINGGLVRRQGEIDGQAVIAYVCTIDVANLDESIAAAEANGGKQAIPKWQIPGVGWLAYYKDTEGNIFGMLQPEVRQGKTGGD